MSAILGCVNFTGQAIDRKSFGAALAALGHYGRDGSSMWVEGAAGFGYQHLEVTPASEHECQPLREGPLLIVADAILDNRDALCEQLALEPQWRFRLPDSQLLLYAYRRWGEACVERLVGDFAFAIWDSRAQVLFCARDHIGARPLYYCRSGERFLFATNIRAFQAMPDLALGIDESRVAQFLTWPLDAIEDCFFRGVYHLPPGHWVRVDRHGTRLHAYWRPREVSSIRYSRREEYIEHFQALLLEAVGDRLNTRYPVGSHISGGLDSTGVTIVANRLMQARGRRLDMGYSWSPPVSAEYPLVGRRRDERLVIDAICRQEGMSCRYGTTTGRDYLEFLARDMAMEGTTDLFEELGVMREAAQRQTRVMLSGWGGDESATFGVRGYPGYLLARGQWRRLFSIARKAAGGLRRPGELARFLWQEGVLAWLPDSLYAHFSPYLRTDQLDLLYCRDFIERHAEGQERRMPAWREYPDPLVMQALLLTNGHLGCRMSTWAHWSAIHGMIYRYPLTDLRVLRFTLGLPPELLWYQGQARRLYRDALGDRLPRQLGKNDNANEQKRMKLHQGCWQLLAEQAAKGAFQQPCDWLDMPALRTRLAAQQPMTSPEILLRFLPLASALRIFHLWQRYASTS